MKGKGCSDLLFLTPVPNQAVFILPDPESKRIINRGMKVLSLKTVKVSVLKSVALRLL
jgi:hypothetical protein